MSRTEDHRHQRDPTQYVHFCCPTADADIVGGNDSNLEAGWNIRPSDVKMVNLLRTQGQYHYRISRLFDPTMEFAVKS